MEPAERPDYSDQATDCDELDFNHYAEALAEILATAETPFTVGIFGPWGSGKSSLLLMLQKLLERPSLSDPGGKAMSDAPKRRVPPRPKILPFNAWVYDQEPSLWRALLLRVVDELRVKGKNSKKARELDDLQASLYRDVDRTEKGGMEIDLGALVKGGAKAGVKIALAHIPGYALLDTIRSLGRDNVDAPDELFDALKRKTVRFHLDQVKFVEQFRGRFEKLIKDRIGPDNRLVVFVDDLDRCLPEKAVQVLEAIKLFLDVKGCVFVLAVDPNLIARGIEHRYRDYFTAIETPNRAAGATEAAEGFPIRGLPLSGRDYLEKIIQIPFSLPPIDEAAIRKLAEKKMSGLPSECANVVACGIDRNPRKVKRVIHLFRLHRAIARATKLTVATDVRLAKVVCIQTRYPAFVDDWQAVTSLPAFLEERLSLEKELRADMPGQTPNAARGEDARGRSPRTKTVQAAPRGEVDDRREPAVPSPRELEHAERAGARTTLPAHLDTPVLEKWGSAAPIRAMLEVGFSNDEMCFRGLESAQLKELLHLARATTIPTEPAAARPEEVDDRLWQALVSGEADRARSAAKEIDQEHQARYAERLTSAVVSNELSSKARVFAGDALAVLGDPRGTVMEVDGIELLPIAAGKYTIGSDGSDELARADEREPFEFPLGPYEIARFPVTVSQFSQFCDDGGYGEERFWEEAVDLGVWRGRAFGGRWDSEARRAPATSGDPFELPNHPVVGVSWFEALAFTRWLTERWRKAGRIAQDAEVRLPSEPQWEAAARGSQRPVFPWGNEADVDRANFVETGIRATSAGGCFPRGASWCGAEEMAGNAWEWTSSEYGRYPYPQDGSRDLAGGSKFRVVRGGSFDNVARLVRAAVRLRSHPGNRNVSIGFRVVVSRSGGA